MNNMSRHRQPTLLQSRRGFLIASAFGLVALPSALALRYSWLKEDENFYITSRNDLKDQSYITAVDIEGNIRFEIPVGARCHGIAVNPQHNHKAVVFPKRPGYIAYLINFETGQVENQFNSGEGRYFYGHGSFSKDGRYLFSTENDFNNQRGIISIRDGSSMKLLGECPSFGIGPHELCALHDGETLVIANGGVFEHPETGGAREKLNINEMQPSLVYVDIKSQKLLGEFRLENRFLGIRHLSITNDNTVAVAIQNEGPADKPTPLLAFHRPGKNLELADAPAEILKGMNHFGLSVCLDPKSGVAGLTCPKGDLVVFWNSRSGDFVASHKIKDASGITLSPDQGSFVVTNGLGQIHLLDVNNLTDPKINLISVAGAKWDNHISSAISL